MYIPGRLGALQGWKAILVAVPIVGFFVWEGYDHMPHYRSMGSGTWQAGVGETCNATFEAHATLKLRVTLTGETVVGKDEYEFDVLNDSDFNRVRGGTATLSDVHPIFRRKGNGSALYSDVSAGPGKIHVLLSNLTDKPIAVPYKIEEYE